MSRPRKEFLHKVFSGFCKMAKVSSWPMKLGKLLTQDKTYLPKKRYLQSQNNCREDQIHRSSDEKAAGTGSNGSKVKRSFNKGRWLHLHNREMISLLICLTIVSIPVLCIYIGYSIGTYFMPPAAHFPSPGIIMDMSRMNYSWYKSHNITIEFIGGLGNQMFQYASLYGLGKANGLNPLISEHSSVARTFRSLRARRTNETNAGKSYGFYQERRSNAFDQRTFSLNFMRNIRLEGYFQSWRYFDYVRSDLRKQFAFRSGAVKLVDEFLQETLSSLPSHRHAVETGEKIEVKFVGVHIRRGDFLDSSSVKKGYTVADKVYLSKALRYYENKYERVIFIVCSDDLPWSRENLISAKGLIVFSKFENSPQLDLCLLSKCNHSIITVGTFGWWGAWLAGGETVYYKDYPRPESTLRDNFRMGDYYLPRWIAM